MLPAPLILGEEASGRTNPGLVAVYVYGNVYGKGDAHEQGDEHGKG